MKHDVSNNIDVQEPNWNMGTMDDWYLTNAYSEFISQYRLDNPTPTVAGTPEDQALLEKAEKDATAFAFEQFSMTEKQTELATIALEYSREGHIDMPFYVIRQSIIDEVITSRFPNGKLPVNLNDTIDNIALMEMNATKTN
jgi:hypothetical protein